MRGGGQGCAEQVEEFLETSDPNDCSGGRARTRPRIERREREGQQFFAKNGSTNGMGNCECHHVLEQGKSSGLWWWWDFLQFGLQAIHW